jgi:hypothetical protein
MEFRGVPYVTVPRGYEVAAGATYSLTLSGRDCHREGICALCAEGGDAVRLRDGECPRCQYVDPYALEEEDEHCPCIGAERCSKCWSEDDYYAELDAARIEQLLRDSYAVPLAELDRQHLEEADQQEAWAPPPFFVDTAFGEVAVTPLADGRYVFKGAGTFGCRETIKAASLAAGVAAGWDSTEKSWTVAAGTDIRAALPAPPPPPPPPPPPRRREEWSREEYQLWLARSRKKVHGPCCSFAAAYESRPYGPICYRCERHGETYNNWTGD